MDDADFQRQVMHALGEIKAHMEDADRRFESLEDDVHGNGDDGLRDRMARLEERDQGKKTVYTAISGLLVAIVAGLGHLQYLIR